MIQASKWLLLLSFIVPSVSFAADEDVAPESEDFRRSKTTRDEQEGKADKRNLRLTTGEDKVIDLDFEIAADNGINIGNPTVVAVQSVRIGEQRQLVFKPLKAGDTTVTVRDTSGIVQLIFDLKVTGTNLLKIKGELADLLRDIEGLDIRIVGPKVIIEGEVVVPGDYGKLLTVIQDAIYRDLIINLTTLSPLALQFLAKKIQDDSNTFAPNVRTRVVNGLIFLEGTVEAADTAQRVFKLANLYVPELRPGQQLERDPGVQRVPPRSLIQNFIIINPPPPRKQEKMVRVTVNLVELKKEYLKGFSFKWNPFYQNDPEKKQGTLELKAGGGSDALELSTIVFNLFPKLNSAQSAGYAKVLRTVTGIARSGQPATFAQQQDAQTVILAPNGQLTSSLQTIKEVTVNVTPLILGQTEDIQLDLDLSQKNVVGRTPAGAPITASNRVRTKIYVKNSESAAIAGMNNGDSQTDFNKDDPDPVGQTPGASQLFNMSRSKTYKKEKSQVVVFVTPQIIENASEGTEDLKKNFRVKGK